MITSNNTTIRTNSSVVLIGEDALNELELELNKLASGRKVFLLVDENTLELCVPELITRVSVLSEAEIIELESGEENKVLDVCYQIWKTLSECGADRSSVIINLGGGVITDMGGFIASTYKRGIDFINIPTTLLSQIDASVGGKVGVDFDGLKNMIGVFNEPLGVFIYPNFLKTLDKRQMFSGYAEALKHALIKDADYWEKLKKGLLSKPLEWSNLITTSVNIKNEIVLSDPKEAGERKLLNFGHTIGHAFESYSLTNDKTPLLHGEAVAIGMICEAFISNKKTGLTDNELEEITEAILEFYPKYEVTPSQFHFLLELMKHDKKNSNGQINFTLLNKIGAGAVDFEIDMELIIDALSYYANLK